MSFECPPCNYSTDVKGSYSRHCASLTHRWNVGEIIEKGGPDDTAVYPCFDCGEKFPVHAMLQHTKDCPIRFSKTEIIIAERRITLNEIVMKSIIEDNKTIDDLNKTIDNLEEINRLQNKFIKEYIKT